MARRIVSFTPSGAYVFRNLRHTTGNYPLVIMDANEKTSVHFDLNKYLADDELITGTAVSGHGAVIGTLEVAEDQRSFEATGISHHEGYADIAVTTSAGEAINTRLYVRDRSAYWRDRYHRETRW